MRKTKDDFTLLTADVFDVMESSRRHKEHFADRAIDGLLAERARRALDLRQRSGVELSETNATGNEHRRVALRRDLDGVSVKKNVPSGA